jgi:hypothetical protein
MEFYKLVNGNYQGIDPGQPIPEGAVVVSEAEFVSHATAIAIGPLTCTPFQIRAALTKLNLRASVEAAVSASTDQSVKDAWQYAQQFIENDPFIVSMATQLGQTSDQIHQLFQLAQTLQP